jgi:hypothetical protein
MKKIIAAALLLMMYVGPAYSASKHPQNHPKNEHIEHHQKPHMDLHREQSHSHHK